MNTQESRRGLPLVICAPSGAGKTTLVNRLTAEFSLDFSVSCTTRAPRGAERDGVEYFFLSRETFLERRDRGEFAEWAEVHGNFYGTPLQPVREHLAEGRDMLFDIDVQGAAQLALTLPEARFVFILPPSLEVLEQRLRGRGTDGEDAIRLRLANARKEIMESHWFHALIVNDDLDQAYDELRAFYVASRLHPSLRPRLARAVCG
ncbi:guanylate kinase [uncultured Mailhella sp.]|uniref:guanylate kinase n=1 Tax=uncultured Mailhella sp. TaxID=1981031 RepID=UPI00260DAD46|nr:guanylate kinase [uncultured Mailhella sp.]